ncbi:unnamed protein product [Schistosoma mattheei]|uniref:Enhancer of polycomb-like protein n=1 Tax=Schistosoma mattheei TaxID=31246 RepID=A0A183Q821_9TREM|nr:unnamed protein product [Schistosoma mattheei]
MSKVSFRARQIDFNKPLPILKHGSELFLEISENALVNRGVPQIPSGMEKEEENVIKFRLLCSNTMYEHHFLEVIQALQLRTDSDVKIPVPEIIDKENDYKRVYPDSFSLPKQLLHIRKEPIEYDMDSEDEEWFQKSDLGITPEKFESMIDRLERGCGQKVYILPLVHCL